MVSDAHFKIFGSDAGSQITALDLDMENAGRATFNNTITATGATFTNLRLFDPKFYFSGGPSNQNRLAELDCLPESREITKSKNQRKCYASSQLEDVILIKCRLLIQHS